MPNASPPNDPLFQYQWGLLNTGQQGGHPGVDINVLPVWPQFTGSGVRVGVIDDGVQLNQPDLAPNIDVADSYDAVRNISGGGAGGPTAAGQNHGTAVAGIIGAAANNGIGGSGVAPGATLISFRIPLGNDPLYTGEGSRGSIPTQAQAIANAFTQALKDNIDVASNSWGSTQPFGDNFENAPPVYAEPLAELATEGRGGKGTPMVFANGNDRAANSNGDLNGLTSSRFVIAVGAIDNNGVASSYSNPGANLLVCAPGGASTGQLATQPGNGITTTDRTGPNGYNPNPSPGGDYTYAFNGTSAATPFVSGVVALMLQADPNLGYRDVQQILAYSARLTDPSSRSWLVNGAGDWNGGGLHFNLNYGFGLVDAEAAVRLAQSYAYLGRTPQDQANVSDLQASDMPASPVAIGAGLTEHFTLGQLGVEHADLNLGLTAADTSSLKISLVSPSGTAIPLLPYAGPPGTAWPGAFSLGTDAFWGEQALGTWTLQITPEPNTRSTATFDGATLTAYGSNSAAPNDMVYTDDFAAMAAGNPARAVIHAPAGTNVFNAAAVSGGVTLNLGTGAGLIDGTPVTVAAGTAFASVIGGDGNDIFTGSSAGDQAFAPGLGQNLVVMGGGNDSDTSVGQDTVRAGAGSDTISAASGTLFAIGGTGRLDVNGGGAVTVQGGTGGTTVAGGQGQVVAWGQASGDLFLGGAAGGNQLLAGAAATTLVGGGSGDILAAAQSGGDLLVAGSGNETLSGSASAGANTYFGGSGPDLIVAGGGNDTVVGGSGAGTIFGGAGRGAIFAGSGPDVVVTGAGGDYVQASAGSTDVFAGAGADLFGFVAGAGGGADFINGFNAGADRITLQGYGADAVQAALNSAQVSGGSTTISLADNTRITLVDVSHLSAAAFV